MARIRVKQGNNEIEIDSRDFYVDNDTAEEVIEALKQLINDKSGNSVIDSLEDAEFHEPEFSEPVNVTITDIKNKLRILAKNSFFNQPRTVGEAVSQLSEYGWSASPLDVSVALTKMAFNKEVLKNTQEDRNFYFSKEALLTN
jgi:transcription initiation factor IIE alpha subunit|tara:strand:- start:243 stop:671 length:429 start_codon:yes stop_codon:yes gene_type:complete